MTPTITDLVDGLNDPRYLFVEHRLDPGDELPSPATPVGYRTFLVLDGTIRVGGRVCRRLQGWHAAPGATYPVRNVDDRAATLLEAGTPGGTAPPGTPAIQDLSSYTVTKPWGEETWYTQNLTDPGYAVKRIRMRAGKRSSLQSHRRKSETNYVIEGRATVLGGAPAPDDPEATVDPDTLVVSRHGVGSGWTSPAKVLHRVVAEEEYTAIEVSTPELDDVIRWVDDTGRRHGRIASEHAGGAS
jgi:mannose-6-phosphate isomerase-like protein (cupin superfamily)